VDSGKRRKAGHRTSRGVPRKRGYFLRNATMTSQPRARSLPCTPAATFATENSPTMADGDKNWWEDNKEKLGPGAIGAVLGAATVAAGIWIKKKKGEKDDK